MSSTTQRTAAVFPNDAIFSNNDGLGFAVSTSTWKWAASFVASEPLTLGSVAVYVLTATGTPVAYNVRIETDSSGRPSGSLAWANATATIPGSSAAGWTAELALTASGALTVGTVYHLVVAPATDPASANYLTFNETNVWGAGSGGVACYASRFNGSWTTGFTPVFVLVSTDATPKRVGLPYGGGAGGVLTVTNTAWKGVKFQSPAAITAWGCVFEFLVSSTANVSVFLVDNSNTVIATALMPTGFWVGMAAAGSSRVPYVCAFTTPVTLTAGEVYRCVVKDSAGVQRFDYGAVPGAVAAYADLVGGPNFMLTEGTSSDGTAAPTTWTDTATKVAQWALLSLAAAVAPTLRETTTVTGSPAAGGTLTVTTPASAQPGDTLVLQIVSGVGTGSAPTAVGWTAYPPCTGSAAIGTVAVLLKTAGGSEPATFAVTFPSAGSYDVYCHAVAGADPRPNAGGLTDTSGGGSTTTIQPVTTTVGNALVLAAFRNTGGGTLGVSGTGFTSVATVGNSICSRGVAVLAGNYTPGATSTVTAAWENNAVAFVGSLLLPPRQLLLSPACNQYFPAPQLAA